MSSFQALWGGSDVAAAGRPGGESLGRGGAGEAARAAGGPRPDRRLGAGRGAAGADRGAPGPGGAGARPRGAGARPADDRAADVRAVEGARAPLRLGLRDADARGLRLAAAAAVLPDEEVPDESTVRKLTRRLGAELVAELSRLVRAKAQRETRLRARAVRIDSTVVEADVRDPTDAGLAGGGVRTLARAGKRLRAKLGATTTTVRDRSRAVAKRLRALARTLRRRTGAAPAELLALTGQTGRLLAASARAARPVAAAAWTKARALARSRKAKARRSAARILASADCLERLAERSEEVGEQIRKRLAGEPIEDRLVSLFDPDARPIRTGKLGKTTEFGSVEQLAAVTPNTKPGARGLIVPPASAPGNRGENELLPTTVHALQRLGPRPHEVALDGGLQTKASTETLAPLAPKRTFIDRTQRLKGAAHARATSPAEPGPACRGRLSGGS